MYVANPYKFEEAPQKIYAWKVDLMFLVIGSKKVEVLTRY